MFSEIIAKKQVEIKNSALDEAQKRQALSLLGDEALLESPEHFFQAIIRVNEMLETGGGLWRK